MYVKSMITMFPKGTLFRRRLFPLASYAKFVESMQIIKQPLFGNAP
ncbi:hypothetical protein HUG15_21485 [Salicibibacter cibarius]|uniref:Uncharacterized protein n=1 Tax=Salicibibacter cibarius TaxID=2743000 RepID=A0A7T6Z6L2_9BACI|nr:hypothetical protein HUG15_21485 [Salicibibacter cibarius]